MAFHHLESRSKYIFVTGGVISSVGKGVITASIAGLLSKTYGQKIRIVKLDPYLNYDAGTMNPFQHGEVYVTNDGCETDLDLGYYERFSGVCMDKWSNITGGKIMKKVIDNERKGKYLGDTVQINKQVVDEILEFITAKENDVDYTICEIGGSSDDLEARWFIEASRRLGKKAFHVHVCYLPYICSAKEVKTRPIQRSVAFLRGLGINIDAIICRCEKNVSVDKHVKQKMMTFCGLDENQIFICPDVESIYYVPNILSKQGIIDLIGITNVDLTNVDLTNVDLIGNDVWNNLENKIEMVKKNNKIVKVGIVGKYVPMDDAYKSLTDALWSAGLCAGVIIEIVWIDARKVVKNEHNELKDKLFNVDCVVVAGGFGKDAVYGKTLALTYCRLCNIPVLGICFGMQIMAIEYINSMCNINVTSEEFCSDSDSGSGSGSDSKLVKIMRKEVQLGGSMRLGNKSVNLINNDFAKKIYKNNKSINERHRHRYDLDGDMFNTYTERVGRMMQIVGVSDGIPEIIELHQHKFYIGVQFHPEFNSSPFNPNPIFTKLIEIASVTK